MTALSARMYSDLLGKRFARGGRGPKEYDCLGLTMELGRRLGKKIPAFVSSEAELHAQLGNGGCTLADCPRIEAPDPGCVVLLRMPTEHHLAFMVDRFRMIHTTEATGCVIERVIDPMWAKRVMGYYSLEGLE